MLGDAQFLGEDPLTCCMDSRDFWLQVDEQIHIYHYHINPLVICLAVCYCTWPIEILELPFLKMVIFHSGLFVYHRVSFDLRKSRWMYSQKMDLDYENRSDLHQIGLPMGLNIVGSYG